MNFPPLKDTQSQVIRRVAEMKQLVADAESYLHVGVDEAGGGGHNNTDTESVTSATARYEGYYSDDQII